MRKLTDTEFDNLIHFAFEKVASDADKAQRRIENLREGTARPEGLNEEETLKRYRQTLQLALTVLDAVIEG